VHQFCQRGGSRTRSVPYRHGTAAAHQGARNRRAHRACAHDRDRSLFAAHVDQDDI
jgi:hypothetical protein